MKKLVITILAGLMLAPMADARRKKPKAGAVKDGVYTDASYGFALSIHENWKARVNKKDDNVRLTITKKNYGIPSDFVNAPDYTKIPRIVVYVDTTSLGAHAFLDSLTSESFKSNQKKEIVKEFEILQPSDIYDGEVVPKGRSRLEIAGESGVMWKGQVKYRQIVSTSASSVGGKLVRSSYGGAIGAVKHGDHIYLFHVMCEWPYVATVLAEVEMTVRSLNWGETSGDG
ncbi:MAG: hypothetical protein GY867_02630 [bacterium]|nr:hypothetical protein [bacterium]